MFQEKIVRVLSWEKIEFGQLFLRIMLHYMFLFYSILSNISLNF